MSEKTMTKSMTRTILQGQTCSGKQTVESILALLVRAYPVQNVSMNKVQGAQAVEDASYHSKDLHKLVKGDRGAW